MNDELPVPSVAQVAIHPSQFPARVQADLLQSLRTRQVNHKFHYDSVKQTNQWLALHQAFSPSRTDEDCAATYDRAFSAVANRIAAPVVHVLGLGCGGGQKDTRLLRLLAGLAKETSYSPCDVSVAMVLVARHAALNALLPERIHPFVCDLAGADDLNDVLAPQVDPEAHWLITFFGMMPNFEPPLILPKLASLLEEQDWLLLSANLAPGPDYAAGLQRILPLYDNALTRDWLMTFLLDLGVESADGKLEIGIEDCPHGTGLLRVCAHFQFRRERTIRVSSEAFAFVPSERIRLFFSYRHTPARVRELLTSVRIDVVAQWITRSEEEGVFLCRKV